MPEQIRKRIAVVSLGCPKNLVDTECMLALLALGGCVVGAPQDEADVILINTCAFIGPAVEESMSAIREAVGRKRAGGRPRVVVAGCLPQRMKEQLLVEVPGLDAVIGVANRDEVVEAVLGGAPAGEVFYRVGGHGAACADDRGRFRLTPRHTAYLRLSEGCSSGCSYCTIPAIRGPLRSKPLPQVVAEAAELVLDGAAELILIAQDTTAYGQDLGQSLLPELLRRLDALPGLRWLRLMYAHPASLTDEIIAAMAECPKVLHYLDVPLQHISNKVLELMRRRYDRAHAEGRLAALRAAMPDITLRTTFIVGFPGEGQAQYDELYEFVEAGGFGAMGVFAYCPESGTPAAGLPGRVSQKIAQRRRDKLMAAQQQIAVLANNERMDQPIEVLVDGQDKHERTVARHAGQAPDVDGLCFLTEPRPPGQIVRGTVVGYDRYDLTVEPSPIAD